MLLGLGANLGEPVRQLSRAVRRLGEVVRLTAVSAVYRTEPVGLSEQPDFFNLVCRGATELSAGELLELAQRLEREQKRERGVVNGPRTLDVDLLALDGQVVQRPDLLLPHPRLHLRAFVLVPLQEVAPEWKHPVLGLTAEQMMRRAGPLERIERWGALPGWEGEADATATRDQD